MTKREKMARAMCNAIGLSPDALVAVGMPPSSSKRDLKVSAVAWQGKTQPAWKTQLPKVDALLAELREPSEEMLEAGEAIWRGHERAIWQAMIDATEK